MSRDPTKGVLIAAPASGSGKTLLTLGLLRALTNDGVIVSSAKIGPDYIDPGYHGAATNRVCINLDPWAMRQSLRNKLIKDLSYGTELIVCEGVMGLFDGATATEGSTANVAIEIGWPIILIVDVRAQAASAAAIVQGFAQLRKDVTIGGVIFNRVSSDRHRSILRDAMAHYLPKIPVLGFLPYNDGLSLPSRHLGLFQASEHNNLHVFLNSAAKFVEKHIDIEKVLAIANSSIIQNTVDVKVGVQPLGQRIGVARDQAFSFSYPHVLSGWRKAGAEIILFSPLNQGALPSAVDAIYLPGGYPELFAGELASKSEFLSGLQHAAETGVSIFGECGGYMVLGDGLIDADGVRHGMAGLLPVETSFTDGYLHLGYRQVTLIDGQAGNGGLQNTRYRGHEFHYSTSVREAGADALFLVAGANGDDLGTAGLVRGNVAGSFIHLIDSYDE